MGIVKTTLLKMLVGKSGRERLEAYQAYGRAQELDRITPAAARDGQPDTAEPSATPETPPSHPAADPAAGRSLDRAVRDADVALARRKKIPSQGGDRQKLIADALAAHRSKRKALDDLDDETRLRLTLMAMSAFMGRPPDGKSN